MAELQAPHKHILVRDEREKFLVELFDALWVDYREKQKWVRAYEAMIEAHEARFINDHIAFRTLATQDPAAGIFRISRVIEALGYSPVTCYEFPDKHLSSIHYRHSNPQLPKLFITQLKVWELSADAAALIGRSLKSHRPSLTAQTLHSLREISKVPAAERAGLLKEIVRYFTELPWNVPEKSDVLALDKDSQFGAWVLVNGYGVNHFTASVDSHGVPALDDIEKVADAMRKAGIPMKKDIEGEAGTRLRQTSTEAAMADAAVMDGGKKTTMPWSYAYFEIIQRPMMKNPATGEVERFEGFLGDQARNLFEMTRVKK